MRLLDTPSLRLVFGCIGYNCGSPWLSIRRNWKFVEFQITVDLVSVQVLLKQLSWDVVVKEYKILISKKRGKKGRSLYAWFILLFIFLSVFDVYYCCRKFYHHLLQVLNLSALAANYCNSLIKIKLLLCSLSSVSNNKIIYFLN